MLTIDDADGFLAWEFVDPATTASAESSPERKARRSMGEVFAIWRRRLQSRNSVDQSETNRLANAAQVLLSASMGSFVIKRPWLAILVTDIVCYSRLIELDELGTAFRLYHLRRHLIMPIAQTHRGWIVDHAGDGTLMAFARCNDALDCALALQRAVHEVERDVPADRRIELHMGISADTVLRINGELYGNALNVAARLQNLAPPGEIYLSGNVFRKMVGRIDIGFEALGEKRLKNIAKSTEVYRVNSIKR
jgi:class 3 adenylate cyclase